MNIPNKNVDICSRCGRHAIIFAVREVVCYNCFAKASRIKQRRRIISQQFERVGKAKDIHKLDIRV